MSNDDFCASKVWKNPTHPKYLIIGRNLETVITGICLIHQNSSEQPRIQTETEQGVMCTGLRTEMEYSGCNGMEFKTLLQSIAPYRSKTHYVKINLVN